MEWNAGLSLRSCNVNLMMRLNGLKLVKELDREVTQLQVT